MPPNHRAGRHPGFLTQDQGAAVTRMVPETPIEISPPWETGAHVVAALHDRLREIKVGAQRAGPWQTNFRAFLRDWVWTQDEARGGLVARLPEDPYLDEVCDTLMERSLLMVEKSRRVRASWIVSALNLWVAAGGQDPRWPSLMLSTHNRQVVLAARKLKDLQGSAWFLRERVKFLYDQAVARGIQEHWPEFPTCEWTYSEARGSNGARINAVPSGSDQLRGPGATVIHCEEAAFWPRAKSTIAGMLPIVLGGGHVVLVTTAQGGTHAQDIRDGNVQRR